MDNTTTSAFPEFLTGLWDRALGIFDRVADLEINRRELSVQRDVQLFKQAQAFEGAQRQAQFTSTGGEIVSGVSNTTLLLLAAAGVVGAVLLTR